MSFEDIKAEISLLFQQMQDQPKDLHELYEKVHEKLNELKAFGMPLPEDLVKLEEELNERFKKIAR